MHLEKFFSLFALFALCEAPPKKDKKFYRNAACPTVDLVVFLPIIPSVPPRLVSFQALYCIFCVFSYILVSSRVFLCFLWHCTVFLLFLYYCVFLYTFVFLCFLVKCNIVFDILQQLAWATLNSKAKHSTPL